MHSLVAYTFGAVIQLDVYSIRVPPAHLHWIDADWVSLNGFFLFFFFFSSSRLRSLQIAQAVLVHSLSSLSAWVLYPELERCHSDHRDGAGFGYMGSSHRLTARFTDVVISHQPGEDAPVRARRPAASVVAKAHFALKNASFSLLRSYSFFFPVCLPPTRSLQKNLWMFYGNL